MHFLKNYEREEECESVKEQISLPKQIEGESFAENFTNKYKIEAAPNVNVSYLIKKNQDIDVSMKNNLSQKKNQATGYLNYHNMNDFNFNEQFYTFNACGFAQDPTDFTTNKVVGDIKKNKSDISESVFE
jgi:hypothetical protein